MPIIGRGVGTVGLGANNLSHVSHVMVYKLNRTLATNVQPFIAPAAAAVNNVYTKQTFASGIHSSAAAGTQPDFPRNLHYQMSVTDVTNSGSAFSRGTVVIWGRLPSWQQVSESVGMQSLVNAGTAGVKGTQCFYSVESVSFSGLAMYTAFSGNSNSVSFSIGGGGKLMAPQSIHHTSAAIPQAWMGSALQTTTSATSATSNNQYTVVAGEYGQAGISYSSAYSSEAIPNYFLICLQKSNA